MPTNTFTDNALLRKIQAQTASDSTLTDIPLQAGQSDTDWARLPVVGPKFVSLVVPGLDPSITSFTMRVRNDTGDTEGLRFCTEGAERSIDILPGLGCVIEPPELVGLSPFLGGGPYDVQLRFNNPSPSPVTLVLIGP